MPPNGGIFYRKNYGLRFFCLLITDEIHKTLGAYAFHHGRKYNGA